MCHTRLTARSDPSLNFGEEEVGFGSLPIRPRYTAGPQGSAKCGAAAYTVRPSLGSRPMWYTPTPAKNGPATDHFLRSAEWKRNPPFFVPTATTTLSFLIVPAMLTTRHAGQDMHDVPRLQCHSGKRRHHEVFVQKQVHLRTSSASLVDDPIPDSRERGIERLQHAGEVRCIEDDFVLSRRVRTEGGRDPHEDTDSCDLSWRCAGHDTSSRPGHPRRDEKVLVGLCESARGGVRGLISGQSLRALDGFRGNLERRASSREAVGDPRRHDDQCSGEGREARAVWNRCGRGGPARREGERLRSRHRAPPDRRERDPGVPEGPLETRGHPDPPWSTERRCRFRGPGTARRAGAPSPRGEL